MEKTAKELIKMSYKKQIVYCYSWTCVKCGKTATMNTAASPTRLVEVICNNCGEVIIKNEIALKPRKGI